MVLRNVLKCTLCAVFLLVVLVVGMALIGLLGSALSAAVPGEAWYGGLILLGMTLLSAIIVTSPLMALTVSLVLFSSDSPVAR